MATGASSDAAVSVWDTRGKRPVPCSDVDVSDPREVEGGCTVEMRGKDVKMSVVAIVGEIRFASCFAHHTLHVDASGRTVLDILIAGRNPCNDIRPCEGGRGGRRLPWEGRLRRDRRGRLSNRVDVCLDTCMGLFEGVLTFDLSRDDGGRLRAAARERAVGTSGFQFDGRWRGERADFAVRPPAGRGDGGTRRRG